MVRNHKKYRPFLRLPFAKGTQVRLVEGWNYSAEEKEFHHPNQVNKKVPHWAIDLSAAYSTKIFSPVDAVAVASYHLNYVALPTPKKKRKRLFLHQGKVVEFGLGLFVQLMYQDPMTRNQFFIQIGHCSWVSPAIPFLLPRKIRCGDFYRYDPYQIHGSFATMAKLGVPIARNQPIATVGHSGLPYGCQEQLQKLYKVRGEYPSWDDDHAHFEVFRKRGQHGKKQGRIDPFGIYGDLPAYEGWNGAAKSGRGLWLTDRAGKILWADS